jgi:hypothetical protein
VRTRDNAHCPHWCFRFRKALLATCSALTSRPLTFRRLLILQCFICYFRICVQLLLCAMFCGSFFPAEQPLKPTGRFTFAKRAERPRSGRCDCRPSWPSRYVCLWCVLLLVASCAIVLWFHGASASLTTPCTRECLRFDGICFSL